MPSSLLYYARLSSDEPEESSASTVAATAVGTGHHTFKVQGYSRLETMHGRNGSYLESCTFKAAGHTWSVHCYLDGARPEDAGFISLFLGRAPADATGNAPAAGATTANAPAAADATTANAPAAGATTGNALAAADATTANAPAADASSTANAPAAADATTANAPAADASSTDNASNAAAESVVHAEYEFALVHHLGTLIKWPSRRVRGSTFAFRSSDMWGVPRFISKEDLKGSRFLKDDCFAIRCKVTVVQECTVKEEDARHPGPGKAFARFLRT